MPYPRLVGDEGAILDRSDLRGVVVSVNSKTTDGKVEVSRKVLTCIRSDRSVFDTGNVIQERLRTVRCVAGTGGIQGWCFHSTGGVRWGPTGSAIQCGLQVAVSEKPLNYLEVSCG